MSSLFDKITEQKKANWTLDELRVYERSVLKTLMGYHPNSNVPSRLPDQVKMKIAEKGWTAYDNVLAVKAWNEKSVTGTAHVHPVSHLVVNGGVITYTPETVTLTTVTKEKATRANSPIPTPFGESDIRSNIVAFTAFAGQLVKCDKGVWVADVKSKEFSAVFSTSIDTSELLSLATDIALALNEDVNWNSMHPSQKTGMDGAKAAIFMRNAFDSMEALTYNYLNTRIVVSVLRAFVKKDDKWIIRKVQSDAGGLVDAVARTCYEARAPTSADRRFARQFPGIYWYKGGFRPYLVNPRSANLQSVEVLYKSVTQVIGSTSRMSGLLACQRDFSGMQDDIGKRLAFFLSATLSCWSQGLSVNIEPASLGDIPPLKSSLMYWHRSILESQSSLFPHISRVDWKIIVSDNASYAKNQDKYIIQSPCQDAVYIAEVSSLFSFGLANSVIPRKSASAIPFVIGPKQHYILWTDVWGPLVFPETRREYETSILEDAHRDVLPPCAYAFSNSWGLRGILSSKSDLSLLGWGIQVKDGKIASHSASFVPVPLKRFMTEKEWYIRALQDGGIMLTSWLSPLVRYSPICNLVWVNRSAVELHTNLVEQEDGVGFYPTLSRRALPDVVEDEVVTGWDISAPETPPVQADEDEVVRPYRKAKKGKRQPPSQPSAPSVQWQPVARDEKDRTAPRSEDKVIEEPEKKSPSPTGSVSSSSRDSEKRGPLLPSSAVAPPLSSSPVVLPVQPQPQDQESPADVADEVIAGWGLGESFLDQ